jgi:hypothetical protein
MWNLPGETRDQAERTIDMIDRTGFDRVRVNCYIPLPGTVLGEQDTMEFPDEAVDVFTPMPQWRQDGDKNRSAMSDEDYLRMRAEFAALQDRYVEKGHVPGVPDDPARATRVTRSGGFGADAATAANKGAHRLTAERLRRLSTLLAVEAVSNHAGTFQLNDAYASPQELVLVLGMRDRAERRVIVEPREAGHACYASTEHCLISYQGSEFTSDLGALLEHIRQRIDKAPFESLSETSDSPQRLTSRNAS